MATPIRLRLTLDTVGAPHIKISVGGQLRVLQLIQNQTFDFDFETDNNLESLVITHLNKTAADPITAVIVKQISFFGISDPRFVWLGKYTPEYPEPWYSQQDIKPDSVVTNTGYLGWNGVWRLDFAVPVFSWIHQVQNLGWVHP
jgi:hypothetical protein